MQYSQATITLTGFKGKIKYAQFLHDNSEIKYQPVNESSNDLQIKLPQKPNVEIPVIELTLL
jgi:alpha-L-fucosidase